jgi:ComF family protein
MKFSGIRRLARPLAELLNELPIPPMDGVVPVPLTRRTLRERGFNQTLLLARKLSQSRGIPLFMDTLVKKKDTPPQIGLSAKERVSNLRNAFSATGSAAGRKLILVDDVMTTGATVGECAKTLINAGAEEVLVVTLARASTDR